MYCLKILYIYSKEQTQSRTKRFNKTFFFRHDLIHPYWPSPVIKTFVTRKVSWLLDKMAKYFEAGSGDGLGRTGVMDQGRRERPFHSDEFLVAIYSLFGC